MPRRSARSSLRRRFLLGGGAALGAAALAAWRWWPDQGFINPCRAALPPDLANHEVVQATWDDIDPAQFWDCHVHLVGTGDSGSGVWVNPRMENWLYPLQYVQRLFFLNGGCVHNAPGQGDASYVERMANLVDGLRPGAKLLLLAFDHHHDAKGGVDDSLSTFFTPDAYAARVARAHPDYFEWAASIHPYRADAVAALESAHATGARAVKWLPAAMGIDLASPRCDPFFAALARFDIPLIVHGGLERAVRGEGFQHLGNPLTFRRALDHGVRVVVAHCASIGEDRDLDAGPNGPFVSSFSLFARLMDDPRYAKLIYGDISAMTQWNRAGPSLAAVIERTEWHPRLLNGSDYPLPGIMPIFSLDYMVQLGFISRSIVPTLTAIRQHNPLLFDFALKRHLRVNGKRFSPAVFQTRPFFTRGDAGKKR